MVMQAQEFLAAVRDQALAQLPIELQSARSRIRYGMLQLHYGEPRVHYEVWLVRKTGMIEVGLHFEADRDANSAGARELAERALELREFLGPELELEQWSPSWTRLHLTVPLSTLNPGLCHEVADRLATLVRLTGNRISSLPARARGGQTQMAHEPRRHWRRRSRQGSRAG
jgi:hypothetical protein